MQSSEKNSTAMRVGSAEVACPQVVAERVVLLSGDVAVGQDALWQMDDFGLVFNNHAAVRVTG